MRSKPLTKVPKKFWPYFWDVSARKLNPKKSPLFVIQRLLDKGDTESVRWVRRNFPQELVEKTFRRLRDFSPRVGNFWQVFLGIPKEKVACLQPHYLKMRKQLWPY